MFTLKRASLMVAITLMGLLTACVTQQSYNSLEQAYSQLQQAYQGDEVEIRQLQGELKITIKDKILFPEGGFKLNAKADQVLAKMAPTLSGFQNTKIVQNNFSVRDAEVLVKKHNDQALLSPNKNSHKTQPNHDVLSLQEALSDKLGATVNIKSGANGAGTLKINYANLDQLDEIISKIMR